MKKEGALFDLIKSLTKSEKRFIKIHASRYSMSGKNNYLKLFDALDKLNEYDGAKLRKKIKSSSFDGNLRGIKNYLYFLILDSLDFYHKDSSIDRRTSKYINIARILSEKRLDQQSNKIVEKTKKLSEEFNRFENIIALNSLQKITGFKRETISNEDIQNYYKENFSSIENMRTKLEYNKIYDELLFKRLQLGLITNPLEIKRLKSFYNNPYFKDAPKSNSFDVNMYYLLSKIEYYRILMDTKNGGVYIRKLIALFESNTKRIADNLNYYLYALNVFISERVYANDRKEADVILKKIISIPTLIGEKVIAHDMRVQIFQIYYVLLTHISLIFRDYENAIPHIRKFEIEKKRFENYFTPSFRLCMQSNIACVYFGAGQYKQALKWCNEAMSHPPKTRDDVVYVVRILNLLVHYELENEIILPSLIKSTYNNLFKQKRKSQFVVTFFKYLRPLIRTESKTDKISIFIQLREKLLPLIDNKLENDIFDDIDILHWIEKKIQD